MPAAKVYYYKSGKLKYLQDIEVYVPGKYYQRYINEYDSEGFIVSQEVEKSYRLVDETYGFRVNYNLRWERDYRFFVDGVWWSISGNYGHIAITQVSVMEALKLEKIESAYREDD